MEKRRIIFYLLFFLVMGLFISYRFITRTKPSSDIIKLSSSRMKLTSSAFNNNDFLPQKYTCDGESINPPLSINEIPQGTKSLALIMEDPDAPIGTFTHWIVWNINPKNSEIMENHVPENAVEGTNSAGEIGYFSPCPPSGTHRYIVNVFALDTNLNLSTGANVSSLKKAMENHLLDKAELMGKYSRNH